MSKRSCLFILMAIFVLTLLFLGGPFRALLPPLVAIAMALMTREVLVSIFFGIWTGALAKELAQVGFDGILDFLQSLLASFFAVIDHYVLKGLGESSNLMIVVFSFLMGGLMGVITRSGGAVGMVRALMRHADTSVKAQLMTWLLGIVIFFDDYSNSLIVGNSLRPMADRLRMSREKLAFIVDSTAAPVSSLALLSTWIGYEIGLIAEALQAANRPMDPYLLFIHSWPYRFYAILLLLGMPIYILMKREYGPMYLAEKRTAFNSKDEKGVSFQVHGTGKETRTGEDMAGIKSPPEDKCRWINAVLPLVVLVGVILFGIYYTGHTGLKGLQKDSTLTQIISHSNPFVVLIWGSLAATLCSLALILGQRLATLRESMDAWLAGCKSMLGAIFILVLAWGLGEVTKELKTAEVVSAILSDRLPIGFLPALVFLSASLISFATGTSWGTMAILFPLSLPLVFQMGDKLELPPSELGPILHGTVAAVLTGSVFGDHCSPISDTTILASMACQVDHLDHVRTQMPYALLFGLVALLLGHLPAGFGVNPYLCLGVSLLIVTVLMVLLGKKLPGPGRSGA